MIKFTPPATVIAASSIELQYAVWGGFKATPRGGWNSRELWGSIYRTRGVEPPDPPVNSSRDSKKDTGDDLELFVEVRAAGVRVDAVEQTITDVDVIADDSVMSK